MFSGIIESLGQIKAADLEQGKLVLQVATGFGDLSLGESVAINGVCLTVVTFDAAGLATFYASAETLVRTNLGTLKAQGMVNLERAVSLSTRLSGHLVQGDPRDLGRLDSNWCGLRITGGCLIFFSVYIAYDCGWVANNDCVGWYRAGNHRTGRHHGIGANRDAGQNGCTSTN